MERVKERGDDLVTKLRQPQHQITKDDFFALASEPPEPDEAVQTVESALLSLARIPLTMEQAASLPFDYATLPFPFAVAVYVLEKVGALPAKMVWSLLVMLSVAMCHVDLVVMPNKRRPRHQVRPRLPCYPCAAPGAKKSPVMNTFLDDILMKLLQVDRNDRGNTPPYQAGAVFPGGSTAQCCAQLLDNAGYLLICAEEAGNFFPRNYATSGQINQSEHVKPDLLLAFRTGAAPERSLMKDAKREKMKSTQVGMCFMSQFPAARQFIVKLVEKYSNGWAQGFVFTYSKDRPQLYDDDGDDQPVLDFLAEVFQSICATFGHSQGARQVSFAPDGEGVYRDLHNAVQRCKDRADVFAPDLLQNFAKFSQWAPSYAFAAHALSHAFQMGKDQRAGGAAAKAVAARPLLIRGSSVSCAARFFILLQQGVQVLVTEANVLPSQQKSKINLHGASDIDLMTTILQRCEGNVIAISDVRQVGIPAAVCDTQRFQIVMSLAEKSGLGKLARTGGGRGRGAPTHKFHKHKFTNGMADRLADFNLNPMMFI
jgi:hypothetical protein